MNNKRCQSVSDVLCEFNRLRKKEYRGYWFRGEKEDYENFALTPSIFRQPAFGCEARTLYEEDILLDEVKKRFADKRNYIHSDLEWLAIAQHLRVPTRLLDWSENILVALFFVVDEDDNKKEEDGNEEDGVLYAFFPAGIGTDLKKARHLVGLSNIQGFDSISHYISESAKDLALEHKTLSLSYANRGNFKEKIKHVIANDRVVNTLYNNANTDEDASLISYFVNHCLGRTYYYDAPYLPDLGHRLSAQRGKFTIHCGKHFESALIIKTSIFCLKDEGFGKEAFIKIQIDGKSKKNILEELGYMGIDKYSLFPEEENKARSILKCCGRANLSQESWIIESGVKS